MLLIPTVSPGVSLSLHPKSSLPEGCGMCVHGAGCEGRRENMGQCVLEQLFGQWSVPRAVCELLQTAVCRAAPDLLPGGDRDGQRCHLPAACCAHLAESSGVPLGPSWAQAWPEAEPGATIAPIQSCFLSGDVWRNTFSWTWLSLPCAVGVLALGFWGKTDLPRAGADV